ncbi:MAG: hypothetical protein JRI26_08245, partial [Deltaproteobacteria bacterium]|nr:hypothetical protein [Deltaproteobacteria bacterium]
MRYIHMNPLRAGIVKDLKELKGYQWCGHSGIMGHEPVKGWYIVKDLKELKGYQWCGHSGIMGSVKRKWQDVNYVLGYFGRTVQGARKAYLNYIDARLDQGHRDELTGGGLIRSLGGWSEVKRFRLKGQSHIMSDERILG